MENNDENKDIDLENNNEEEVDLEIKDDEESDDPIDKIDDIEELRKRAKGYRAVATRKKTQPKLETKAKTTDNKDILGKIELLEMAEKKRQFGYEHGLSPEQTDRVFRVNPNPSAEDLKDPFIQAGLNALKRKESLEKNIPETSAKTSAVLPKDFDKLSPQEKDAAYEKFMKERLKKRG